MLRNIFVTGTLLISTFFLPGLAEASCRCHSDNPRMVKMHEEISASGVSCFRCHGPSNALQGRKMPPNLEEAAREPLCQPCHKPR